MNSKLALTQGHAYARVTNGHTNGENLREAGARYSNATQQQQRRFDIGRFGTRGCTAILLPVAPRRGDTDSMKQTRSLVKPHV